MSTPYSRGGIPEEWAALFRNYAIGALLGVCLIWMAGFSCGRLVAHRNISASAASARALAWIYADSLDNARSFNATLIESAKILEARLDSAQRHTEATGRVAARLTRGVTIDTSGKAGRNPYRSVGSLLAGRDSADAIRSPVDTTAWAIAMRAEDTTHYLIPKFIGDGYLALQAHAVALQEAWDTEKALRETAQSRFADDSTRRVSEWRYSDSLHAADQRQIAALTKAAHPWCGFKCGALTTLAVLAAAAITLHEVRR